MRPSEAHRFCTFSTLILVCVLAMFSFPEPSYAQETNRIELVSANLMVGSGKEIRTWIGHVYFIQRMASGQKVHLWCDSATQYIPENRVELFGHVKIVRDTTTITADRGRYFGNERRAEVSSHVRLLRGGSVLTSTYGQYFVDEKKSHFSDNVHLVDTTSSITCNDLTYFETTGRSVATGNVRVVNFANSVTILGDSLVHVDSTKYSIVPKNPRLIQIDTSSSGVVDTLVVVSHIMESFQDSTENFVATDSVEMARGELSSRSGRATYYVKKDLIILRRQPIVWQAMNEIMGDSIDVRLQDKKLRTVHVSGHAVAISRSDSLYRNRYNQLTGREITMQFANDQLDSVFVNTTATSFYYLYDKNEPDGANKSSGDRIYINFVEGKIDRIKIVGGVQGQYFPEKMLAHHENLYNLDGFKWFDVRPRRYLLAIVNQKYD